MVWKLVGNGFTWPTHLANAKINLPKPKIYLHLPKNILKILFSSSICSPSCGRFVYHFQPNCCFLFFSSLESFSLFLIIFSWWIFWHFYIWKKKFMLKHGLSLCIMLLLSTLLCYYYHNSYDDDFMNRLKIT